MSRIPSGWGGAKRILAAMPGSSGRRQHFELCALSGRGQTPVVGHDGLKVFADRQRGGQVNGVERPERCGIERRRAREDTAIDVHEIDPGKDVSGPPARARAEAGSAQRSEEHTSELQSQSNLVCRLLLEKKNKKIAKSFLVNKYVLHYVDTLHRRVLRAENAKIDDINATLSTLSI